MSIAVLPKDSEPPSGLCEFQGLMIQWFLITDALFCLSMATNVFLVFFYGYDAQQLRHLEKWYVACSYGIPALPVLVYFILGRTGNEIIGSATLWCWVSSDVEWMRIAFFYAPTWIVITTTISIYIITGYRIWKKRAELRSVSRSSHHYLARNSFTAAPEITAPHPFVGTNNIVVTTQIKCHVQPEDAISRCVSPEPDQSSINSFSSTRLLSSPSKHNDTVTETLPVVDASRTSRIQIEDVEAQRHPHNGTRGRNGYRATVIATSPAETSATPTTLLTTRPVAKRTAEGHAAAMAYFQVAFLMFVALLVVWLPSSINRMYQFTHRNRSSFALNIISAIVLPLQGAWNATIYIFTTRSECRRAWGTVKSKLTGSPLQHHLRRDAYRKETMTSSRDTQDSGTEIALDDFHKHDVHVRHAEVSNGQATEEGKAQRHSEPW
ncbi:uncharacterized protein J4E87_007226 [Alternaria ethzedia]|uniref:uncharacterized protein n=1 Tax=Alternaria ethzedia TaxID=181014 RepID=UPI0020C27F36|nr:uncharacterized protein J4E87_007226 [Alternaria ethzedia]KAI4620538.1 hypothetical protein J4E87_007226 [Alternaria ethzedia]